MTSPRYCNLIVIGGSKQNDFLKIRKLIHKAELDARITYSTVRSLSGLGFVFFNIQFRKSGDCEQFIKNENIEYLQNEMNGSQLSRTDQKAQTGSNYLNRGECMVFGLEAQEPLSYDNDPKNRSIFYLAKTKWKDTPNAFKTRTDRMKERFSLTQHDGYINADQDADQVEFIQQWSLLDIHPESDLNAKEALKNIIAKNKFKENDGKVFDFEEFSSDGKKRLAFKPEEFEKSRPGSGNYGYALICARAYQGQTHKYLDILTEEIDGFDLQQDSIRDLCETTTKIIRFKYKYADGGDMPSGMGEKLRGKIQSAADEYNKNNELGPESATSPIEIHFVGVIDANDLRSTDSEQEQRCSWEFCLTGEKAEASSLTKCLENAFGGGDCKIDFVQVDEYADQMKNTIARFGAFLYGEKNIDHSEKLLKKACADLNWKYERID